VEKGKIGGYVGEVKEVGRDARLLLERGKSPEAVGLDIIEPAENGPADGEGAQGREGGEVIGERRVKPGKGACNKERRRALEEGYRTRRDSDREKKESRGEAIISQHHGR